MALFVLLVVSLGLLRRYSLADGCQTPVVEILVSPIVEENSIRALEISWDFIDGYRNHDWVGLYREPPSVAVRPVFRAYVNGSSGSVKTGVQEGRTKQKPNFVKRCLGWWAAYWHEDSPVPVTVSCLETNPRWMEENQSVIGNMRIDNMFIPGTHDSGAFYISYRPFMDNRLTKYVYTQDETILEQLIHGARVLDLRITLRRSGFWINHGLIPLYPLDDILNDIKIFIDHTKEVVILDIHELRGMKTLENHHRLIQIIKSKLGNHMAPPEVGWDVTLNHLWSINKRVIVAYNDMQIAKDDSTGVFWPVNQQWANRQTPQDLFIYFVNFLSVFNRELFFWSIMAEMTPLPWQVIADSLNGLRAMADESNKNVTSWFRGDWGGIVNGVSVDFIRSTGIVDAAIKWNLRRARGQDCD